MTFLYIVLAILILGIIIVVHEFGHFLVGRILGFRILEFSVGMGPKLLGWGKGETKYSLRAVPLGGFCAFAGEDEDNRDDPRAMNNMPWYKRFLVLISGAGFNIIFAVIMGIVLSFAIGDFAPEPYVNEIREGSPLAQYDIRQGDRIVEFNGVEITSAEQLIKVIGEDALDGKTYEITVERDGKQLSYEGTYYLSENETQQDKEMRPMTGIIYMQKSIPVNFFKGIGRSFEMDWELTKSIFAFFGSLFTGQADMSQVTGPISTIGEMSNVMGESAAYGAEGVLLIIVELLWMIGINVAIFNLLPIPALDGGRVVFVLVEAIRRKPVKRELEATIHSVAFMVIIGLVVVLEISRLFLPE